MQDYHLVTMGRWKTPKWLKKLDPTDKKSLVRKGLRAIDITSPKSIQRKALRQLDPTSPKSAMGKVIKGTAKAVSLAMPQQQVGESFLEDQYTYEAPPSMLPNGGGSMNFLTDQKNLLPMLGFGALALILLTQRGKK